MATPTRKSPSTKNATSPGKNDVRLLQRIRVLKEKCNKLEIERDEAESDFGDITREIFERKRRQV